MFQSKPKTNTNSLLILAPPVINVIDTKIGSIEILIARQFLLDNPSLYPPSKQLNTIRSTLPTLSDYKKRTSAASLIKAHFIPIVITAIKKLYELTRVIKPSLNNSNYSIALERTVKKTTTYLLQCRTNSSFTLSVINSVGASNGYMLKPTELKYCKMLSPLTWRLVVSLCTPNVVAG